MLTIVTVLALTTAALGHGGVLSYLNAGITYKGFVPYNTPVGQNTIQRQWATYDPITDPASPTIACNNDGTSIAGQLDNFMIAAGSQVTAYWNQIWPHPYGPMLTYLAKCPGTTCTGVNAGSLKWFKIDQSGLISGTIGQGTWGSGKMINDNSSWTSTIPSSVPAGPYLLRFETIALHSQPAQFYPECAQVHITGSGTRDPIAAELVSFPGAYKASDPGINVDLYSQANQVATNYVIPGPPLYGSSGSSGPTQTTTNTGQTSTTFVTTKTTTSPTSTTTTPVGTVVQYGQCGGLTYTGPTACVSPYRCVVVNDYYSQCLA